jgi:hypothetical protein
VALRASQGHSGETRVESEIWTHVSENGDTSPRGQGEIRFSLAPQLVY